jgi:hypothetical protein
VISILTGIMVVIRNPGSQAAQNRNLQRQSDIKEIAQSVHQLKLHNSNIFPKTNDGQEIANCDEGTTVVSELSGSLVPDYLTEVPIDPQDKSEYTICRTGEEEKIIVSAPSAELSQKIEITR